MDHEHPPHRDAEEVPVPLTAEAELTEVTQV